MKIKVPIEIELSELDRRKITEDYLRSLLPEECEIREENIGVVKKWWYIPLYDARGDKIIRLEKHREVTKLDEAILIILEKL
jgi:hypothetical protein